MNAAEITSARLNEENHIPGPNQMRGCKDHAQQDAQACDDDICNTQKRVLAAHHGPRADQNTLCPAESSNGKVCYVSACLGLVKSAIEILTVVDRHLVSPACHDSGIVPEREFAK